MKNIYFFKTDCTKALHFFNYEIHVGFWFIKLFNNKGVKNG